MTPFDSLKKKLKRFNEFRLDNVSVEKCEQLLDNIDQQCIRLEGTTDELYDSSRQRLDQNDATVLGTVRHKLARINDEMDGLARLRKKISDSVERRKIRSRMAERIGGPRVLFLFEMLIIGMIVAVLVLLVYDFEAGPDENRPALLSSSNIFWFDFFCCLFFMSEFLLRLSSADNKRFVWKHHWVDFVTSIPIPGPAQLARFGRFGRLIRVVRLLRFARFFFLLWRGLDAFQDVMDIRLMKKTIKYAVAITLLGAFLIYQLEGAIHSATGNSAEEVGNFPLALWWSFTTVATGGFGDIYNPESGYGQLLTGFLVITGMVLIGVFTATLTSIFVGEQAEEIERLSEDLGERVDEISDKLDRLGPAP
ncbi:MAG: ion transporter [Mariniblastus sp.]|nr:ion transporter [Mariniblastus sp.]